MTTAAPATVPKGIAYILAGMFCLTLSDALAKHLSQLLYSPLQIMFLRAGLALPIVLVATLALGGRRALASRHVGLHLGRGALNLVSAVCFYMGLRHLPLAENVAIAFAAPLFVTALSVWWLQERVDARRWLAVGLGFVGVLLVVRPGATSFQAAALYPLVTAFFYALMMISARAIGPGEGMLTTMFYIVAGQLACSSLLVPWFWRTPDWSHLPFFVAMALLGTLGLTLVTQAFRIAPASVVAPFDYSGMGWAVLLGWLVWDEVPPVLAYAGMAGIVASGLYIVWRENRQRRKHHLRGKQP